MRPFAIVRRCVRTMSSETPVWPQNWRVGQDLHREITEHNGEKVWALHSAGVLLVRKDDNKTQFLLMKHKHRDDLPKGHRDRGESVEQTALRELCEETGLAPEQVRVLDPSEFRYDTKYYPTFRNTQQVYEKRLTILLGLLTDPEAEVTGSEEHAGFEWCDWPSSLDNLEFAGSGQNTLPPLLRAAETKVQSM
ncbi:MAG: hypothetical protein MHM6MM_006105 [Cercozoa sp. M6MM]